ncbi:hypothetical protein Pla52n_15260 [Stieleria varia]|uniref:Uncharacterized protein n=1 Tax=Stieleria varia TaxID=2528005 RepID=A0A5C6B2P8_9BACT|nr:hypothetical protein Pla52n_15260 [Stieleria varia]
MCRIKRARAPGCMLSSHPRLSGMLIARPSVGFLAKSNRSVFLGSSALRADVVTQGIDLHSQ